MALHLTFAEPLTTPQGFALSEAYARVVRAEYQRTPGLISYSVDYYLTQAAAENAEVAALTLPGLRRHFANQGAEVAAPSGREDVPDGVGYAGITPAEANAAGVLTLAYQHLCATLTAELPGVTLAKS